MPSSDSNHLIPYSESNHIKPFNDSSHFKPKSLESQYSPFPEQNHLYELAFGCLNQLKQLIDLNQK